MGAPRPHGIGRWIGVFLLLSAFCLFSSARADEKAEPVIYPRGTGQSSAVEKSAAGSGSNTLLVLAVALLAGAGGWWLWQKRRHSALPGGKTRLSIAESRSLGSRQYLVVADYDGKKFLLGVCPGSIELLTPLDGEPRKEP